MTKHEYQSPISYVDSSIDVARLSYGLPSVKLIKHSLGTKNYHLLDNVTVIPGNENGAAVLFKHDIWSSKHLAHANEPYRRVDFSRLPENLKNEVKVIGIYLIWFSIKKSKISSIIRIIENIMLMAIRLVSINVPSLFWLDREPIQKEFIKLMFDSHSHSSIDNYFKCLSRLCDMQYSVFGESGFCLRTNFQLFSPGRKDNQTYCMPMNILGAYWLAYINYFNGLDIDIDDWSYISNLPKEYRLYLKMKKLKHHANNWLEYLNRYCQNSLMAIYDKNESQLRCLITKRTEEEIRSFANTKYTYDIKSGNRITTRRVMYTNRSYPKYFVNMEKIYSFYNRLAMLACESIQSMTGMRYSEATAIKFGSLIVEKNWIGVKSKLYKFAKEGGDDELWAASPFVKVVFDKMRSIASRIFNVEGKQLNHFYIKTDARRYHASNKTALMIAQRKSEAVLNWSGKHDIIMSEQDISEFWELNPNISDRDRVEKEIYVGAKWPLASHQFRRSIAVHLRRLELITINHLAIHLKHLGRTITEWYADGALQSSGYSARLSQAFADELERADLERSAALAIKFQESDELFGRGAKNLQMKSDGQEVIKVYKSFSHAMKLAARKKAKVMSLGNGMYCLNGAQCEFKAIVQAANCRPNCDNLIADKSSIPVWQHRYGLLNEKLKKLTEEGFPNASLEFIRLEMATYTEALDYFGVKYE